MHRFTLRFSLSVLVISALTLFSLFFLIRAAFSAAYPSFFGNYLTWTYGRHFQGSPYYTLATSANSLSQRWTFTDINGDGLPDFLYFQVSSYDLDPMFYAVFLSNGNNNFNLAYKCVADRMTNVTDYYGDCVSGAPVRDPNAPENQNQRQQVINLFKFVPDGNTNTMDTMWLDLNGDGLQDYISRGGCFHINNGNIGFTQICS